MKRSFIYFFLPAFICFLVLGCVSSEPASEPPPPPEDAIYRNPSYTVGQRVADLLSYMTLEEKIGQMTQVAKNFLSSPNDIKTYCLGSVLSGGGMGPVKNEPGAWADMYDHYQSVALESRLGIPILYGIDAVHGHNTVKGAVIFPHNIGLGCTGNPALVEKAAQITAIEVAATGIDWTFAPCIAVPRDERWGRTYEGFGETPGLAEIMAEASIRGYQGESLEDGKTILACPKHFLADGGTKGGDDQGNAECSEEILRKIHLPGYISALKAGSGSVMASFSSWNGKKMHGNKDLLTGLLKNELGFPGILVSDWKAIDQLPGDYTSDVTISINAGLDMIMVPDDYKTFITTLLTAVKNGKVPRERIDDAVKRILTIKFKLGLFEQPYTDRSLLPLVGCEEHREAGRECVRQSLVLLKNKNNVLPLSKETGHILVAGRGADDIGMQCGGWTISWQGMTGDITEGTTILEAIQKTVSSKTKVTYSRDGSGAGKADIGIVVIGENPYAEMEGDRQSLALSTMDINVINNVKKTGIPIIVILISGRPLIVTPEIDKWDAFIAAWLPGTEGQGIADVLFGDYNPTGKLSHTWPADMKQIPINEGDNDYDPLFPFGFGLSY
ncbi:MAG: glycoside hydrolase family 3 C-terminal domain-containing protein [Spirochaetales bacterium]|nr:glycoside hydrolase family 3 C-terminal domain-containing protein [Spirochaetales bacterium]